MTQNRLGFRVITATLVLAVAYPVAIWAQESAEPPSQSQPAQAHSTPTQSTPTQSAPTQSAQTQSAQTQSAQTQSAQTQSTQSQPSQSRPPSAQSANIHLAILLTDTIDGKTVAHEPLNFVLADRQLGRLRRHLPAKTPFANRNFEIDVTPEIVGSRVRVSLTLNYNTGNPEDTPDQTGPTQFVEVATAFLDTGKPTPIVEANGDTPNRRVTLQLTATIQK
jgi:hypothetical protein